MLLYFNVEPASIHAEIANEAVEEAEEVKA
jgi:hypothetical protein